MQALMFFSAAVLALGSSRPQIEGFVMMKWYKRYGIVSRSHGMRELRWEKTFR